MNSLRLLSRLRTPCYTWNRPARSPLCPRAPLRPFSRPSTLHACPALCPPRAPPAPSPPFHSEVLLVTPTHPVGEGGAPCSDSSCVHPVWPQRTPPSPGTPPSSRQAAEALEASFRRGPERTRSGKAGGGQRGKERGRARGRPTRRRRTHPRPDVVQRFGTAAPAAQTPHPQHRPASAWSSRRPCPELGRLRPSLLRARPRRGVLAHGLL